MPATPSPSHAHHQRLFYFRLLKALGIAAILFGFSLGLGVLGYHFIAGLAWIDALLNASMILTGMGPVDILHSDAAKVFASAYALFSGVAFLTASGILIAPIFHRVLYLFHIEGKDAQG